MGYIQQPHLHFIISLVTDPSSYQELLILYAAIAQLLGQLSRFPSLQRRYRPGQYNGRRILQAPGGFARDQPQQPQGQISSRAQPIRSIWTGILLLLAGLHGRIPVMVCISTIGILPRIASISPKQETTNTVP